MASKEDIQEMEGRLTARLDHLDVRVGRIEADEAVQPELRRHFDEGQTRELGAALVVASGWQRFIEAFGIRPDRWADATPLP